VLTTSATTSFAFLPLIIADAVFWSLFQQLFAGSVAPVWITLLSPTSSPAA
jgi:hypothetical protein